jgi:alkylation response protein AidB-like acyl-CoA dehydrogenase
MGDLRWSDEQQQLAEMLSSLLAKHSDSRAVRQAVESPKGYDEQLWSLLCEQVGVAALEIPEEYGGAGFTFVETAVVLEQLGRFLTPSPLLATLVAAEALLRAGDEAACRRLLPELGSGTVVTLAWSGPTGLAGATEPVTSDDMGLSGTVTHVLDGDTADVLLVAAGTADGTGLFEVAPHGEGVRREHTPTMDQTLRLATVTFENAQATRIGADLSDVLLAVHAVSVAAVAAVQVGVAQRGLDMTVAYAKEREQFGRPIGSFQALKHRMADMLVQVETARSASLAASVAVAEGAADLCRRTSVAKAWCSDALRQVASETVQLHGGIAITWEHDAHLVLKRAHALGELFGAAHLHRARVLAGSPTA